jgi:uncharacterized protein YbcV (DUF1398 family)
MKRYVFLLVICLFGCVRNELQSKAENVAETYIRTELGNPPYFKSISFSALQKRRYTTALDSSMTYAGANGNNRKDMEKYIDSENGQRPDLAINNEKDIYNIEHNKLNYYLLIYSFRIDSAGQKEFRKYRFELDTACNIINAVDITTSSRPETE